MSENISLDSRVIVKEGEIEASTVVFFAMALVSSS